jgi:hypothetical protein
LARGRAVGCARFLSTAKPRPVCTHRLKIGALWCKTNIHLTGSHVRRPPHGNG